AAGNDATNVTGGMQDLLRDYVYNPFNGAGRNVVITVTGLTPGAHYDTRLYTRQFSPGTRNISLAFDTDGVAGAEETYAFNQDDASQDPPGFTTANQAYAISYDFIAESAEMTITATQAGFNRPFLLYGLTNEAMGGQDFSDSINTLFATGLSDSRTPLAPGAVDPHWFVTSTRDPLQAMSPNPAWLGGTGSSQWSGLVSSGSANVEPGTYSFSTEFDLSEYDAATAVISMLVAVDDSLSAVRLNGVDTGISTSGFDAFRGPFTLNSGFLPGLNTLEFVVINGGTAANPSGLHVSFDATAVPMRDNTIVNEGPNTHYFRQTFEYDGDPASEHDLQLTATIDDGAVFYLNGIEVYRHNMPTGPVTYATSAVENVTLQKPTSTILLPADSLIVGGNNVLAVELHQAAVGNSDVRFNAELGVIERPIPSEVLPDLIINEISPAGDGFFVELHNADDSELDLAEYSLWFRGGEDADFSLTGTLEAGGYVAFTAAETGTVPSRGDHVFLIRSTSGAVVDGHAVTNRVRGRTDAYPGQWLYPAVTTPGANNQFELEDEIVINEIFYHAPPKFAEPGEPAQYDVETLVGFSSSWRYTEKGNDLGANWASQTHPVDGVNWLSGPGPLGFESASLSEPIRTSLANPQTNVPFVVTYYFETDFTYDGISLGTDGELLLRHLIDDGAIFYVNGVELTRFNMPAGAVTYATAAASTTGDAQLVGPLAVPASMLVAGTNRLSAEVHQWGSDSSDIVFGAELVTRRLLAEATPGTPFAEDEEEWIELYNRGTSAVDVSGWQLAGGIDATLPEGTSIAPGAYLLVPRDAAAFRAKYPNVPTAGDYSGRLSDNNDLIRLIDLANNPADEVHYFEGGRWPELADAGGSSLELRDPLADNARGESW
ncbi:MAG: lamin tail domain-containing protein, partial [Planctomycetales bacterium]|nr:lamin tail domain-containing protein [Planctomycetales bacterium]